jgi:hypothetical protein
MDLNTGRESIDANLKEELMSETANEIIAGYSSFVDKQLLKLINDPEIEEVEYIHNLLIETLLLNQATKQMKNSILVSCLDTLITIVGTAPDRLPKALTALIDVLAKKEND